MSNTKYLSLYDKEFLKQYKGFIALDIDGVFADTWLSHIRYDHPNMQDPRIEKFLVEYKEYIDSGAIGKHDVRGVQFESLSYLCALASDGKFGFIIVSSWVSNADTCRGVEALMELLNIENPLPFVVGQTRGGGGINREQQFFEWLRDFTCDDLDNAKELIAIDDSGYRHFPIFHQSGNLVHTLGRIGFNMDDYIRSIRKLHYDDGNWFTWASSDYLKDANLPELSRDIMWYLIHEQLIGKVFNPWYEPGRGWRNWLPRFKRWCKWRRACHRDNK